MIRSLRLIRLSTSTTSSFRWTYPRCSIITPHFTPFTMRHFAVENTPEAKQETKQRKPIARKTSTKSVKQPELVVQKTELPEKSQSLKTPFHQALLAFALNNKKHLIFHEESSQPQQTQEGIGKMLKKLRKWKQNRLYKCINDSLVAMTQNKSQVPMLNSTKRLCKSYFSLLQDHCDQMTRSEAASVIYFISKLQLEESEMGQVVLLRAVSRRLCELFREKAELTIPAQQQRQTIRMMEEILHAPLKPLHEQFLSLLIQEQTPQINLSWHEQAQIHKKKKQDKTQNDKKIYELLSPEFHVQLLINWQKTQNIDSSWRWQLSSEEKSNKELTQALVDKFVANENLVDYLTSRQHLPKAQRVKIVPILAKYRGSPQLRQTYTQVLKRLQQGLEDQLTHYQDIKENMRSLVTLLYFIHRSDMEPLERKKSIVRGDLEVEDIPYQNTVLPSLDKLFRGLILKPKKGQPKGNPEIPDFLRYELSQNAFMMLSWLAANTLRFDQLAENSRQSILCNKLNQAHSHLLKENPLVDIFEPSITRYLLSPLKRSQNKDSQGYLNQISQTKLFDRKNCLPEAIDKIELGNLVIDVTPQLDVSRLTAQEDRQFVESLLNSLYYGQMIPYTSLFFFRSQHLENVLDTLSKHPKFQRERDFWLKSEDMILRQREQYDSHKLCRLASIYSRVNPSQLFWVEIEQVLLGKASDFKPSKETAQSLYSVIEALNKNNRRNETFWKVFSTTLSKTKNEFLESQLITLCSIFDAQTGQQLFQELTGRFLTNSDYLLPDSVQLVSKLAISLSKHNATLTIEVGEPKQPLFVMALKYLIVKITDLQEAVTQQSNFDDLVSDMNLLACVLQVPHESLSKEIGLLKTAFRGLAQKIIEKIDLTPQNEALQKVKASVLKLTFDNLSEHSQKSIPGQSQDRSNTALPKIQEPQKDGGHSSPFQHHPRFRQEEKKRSKSRKN